MSYRIQPGCSINSEIQRVLHEELNHARMEWTDETLSPEKRIHQVRKHIKRIRGLLRLIQAALGPAYREENAHYRELAAAISNVRDAEAMINAYDLLMAVPHPELERKLCSPLRRHLTVRKKALQADHPMTSQEEPRILEELKNREAGADQILKTVSIKRKDLAAGLEKNYLRARNAYRKARKSRKDTDLHEWRKRAKVLWYQYRLLQDFRPKLFLRQRRSLRKVGEWVGQDHDLMLLHDYLNLHEELLRGSSRQTFLRVLKKKRKSLQSAALKEGQKVFRKPPRKIRKEFKKSS